MNQCTLSILTVSLMAAVSLLALPWLACKVPNRMWSRMRIIYLVLGSRQHRAPVGLAPKEGSATLTAVQNLAQCNLFFRVAL